MKDLREAKFLTGWRILPPQATLMKPKTYPTGSPASELAKPPPLVLLFPIREERIGWPIFGLMKIPRELHVVWMD
jgi:hypothetical protein